MKNNDHGHNKSHSVHSVWTNNPKQKARGLYAGHTYTYIHWGHFCAYAWRPVDLKMRPPNIVSTPSLTIERALSAHQARKSDRACLLGLWAGGGVQYSWCRAVTGPFFSADGTLVWRPDVFWGSVAAWLPAVVYEITMGLKRFQVFCFVDTGWNWQFNNCFIR